MRDCRSLPLCAVQAQLITATTCVTQEVWVPPKRLEPQIARSTTFGHATLSAVVRSPVLVSDQSSPRDPPSRVGDAYPTPHHPGQNAGKRVRNARNNTPCDCLGGALSPMPCAVRAGLLYFPPVGLRTGLLQRLCGREISLGRRSSLNTHQRP